MKWTPEQDDILTECWSTETVRAISERIGRSYEAVRSRALKIGLRKGVETYPETAFGLAVKWDEIIRRHRKHSRSDAVTAEEFGIEPRTVALLYKEASVR